MKRSARVISIADDSAVVAPETDDLCVACTSPLCADISRSFTATISDAARNLRPGDRVEVRFPGGTGLAKAALFVGTPILGAIAGYLFAGSGDAQSVGTIPVDVLQTILAIGTGVIGGVIGYFLARLVHEPDPTIARVYEPSEGAAT